MWKDVPTWEYRYEINEYGNVRNKQTGKIIKPSMNSSGYYRIAFYDKALNRRERYFVHRLVASIFLNNINQLKEVNHIDGNKHNNHVSNLEWCSRLHNQRELIRTIPERHKPFVVMFNNGETKTYEFASDLSKELGVSRKSIRNWAKGKYDGYKNFNIKMMHEL